MTLSPVVKNHHVEEAIRLFKFSTMDAVTAGSADGMSRGELNEEMTRIEKEIKRRLPVGWSTSYQSLVKEFVTQQGYSSHALERTLFVLEKREIIRFSSQVMYAQLRETQRTDALRRRRLFIGLGFSHLRWPNVVSCVFRLSHCFLVIPTVVPQVNCTRAGAGRGSVMRQVRLLRLSNAIDIAVQHSLSSPPSSIG